MKRTILFAIAIFTLAVGDVAAQTGSDRVIVSGNPALTQSMLDKSRDLFEFAFGGPLTGSERSFYEQELSRQWRGNDAQTIKSLQDIIAVYDKVAALGSGELKALQPQLQELLTKELRPQVEKDALAKVLIGVFDRIQGLNIKQGGDLPVPPQYQHQQSQATSTGGSLPRELLGEWVKSWTSGVGLVGPNGQHSAPSGEKIILNLKADGTYNGGYFVQSSSSVACAMTVFMPSSGVWRFEGNTLKLNERSSRTISKDSCVARWNYEKENKPGTYAYPTRLEKDQYGTKLVLTMNDGEHNFYHNTGKVLLAGN